MYNNNINIPLTLTKTTVAEQIATSYLMGKKSIYVNVENETGRLADLKITEDKGESEIIGTFIGRGCPHGRTVSVKKVTPIHKKAKKALEAELETIQSKIFKKPAAGVKLSPA